MIVWKRCCTYKFHTKFFQKILGGNIAFGGNGPYGIETKFIECRIFY
jgi:hypothetical protein